MNNEIINETTDRKKVCFYECDYKKRFKISEILKLTSELAGDDFTRRGYSYDFLMENNMVFLLSRVSFHIFEYPVDQQVIISSTWAADIKGAIFNRNYEIKDKTGNILIQGTSGWILVEPQTRHIIKPSDFKYSFEKITDRECSAVPNGKIRPGVLSFAGKREIRISDLDANGHVYNAVYADIAIDFLDLDCYNMDIENFRINYITEAKLGSIIDIYISYEGKKAFVIGQIDEKTCFETEFIYK